MGRRAILIALAVFPSLLRSELLPIRSFTTADGLASDHVDCIVPDTRGFLWFCTPEGLSRFDGYRFLTYTVAEGLPHDAITTVLATHAGDVFAGTGRGIARINPTSRGAPFATFAPEGPKGDNSITALRESPGGKLWCATRAAVYEWDGARGFRRMGFQPPNAREQIADILEDRRSALWIATNKGLYISRDGAVARVFTPKDGLPGDLLRSLRLDSQGRIWAIARNGLARFDQRPGGDWEVAEVYTKQSGLAGNGPVAMTESSDGILWVGSDWGISRLTLGGSAPVLLQNIGREQGLTDRQINALAEDSAGNIWAGTGGAGVMRIDRLGFTTYREADGLPTDRTWSVFEDRAGEVLVLTVTGRAMRSLNIFDGARFRNIAPRILNGHATWISDSVFLQSRTGEWWAATSQGLCRFPAVAAVRLKSMAPGICYAPETFIFHIFEDSRGGVWASAQSGKGDQLMRWDPATNALFTFPNPKFPGGPTDDIVNAFAEDAQGNIWMGLFNGGLYRYDGRTFRYLQREDGVPGGAALLADSSGLWIGSNGSGLGRIADTRAEHPRIEIYNTARGLASNIVYCLVADGMGRIYAATGKGIDRIDPKTGHIRHFSAANGLPHGTFRSALRDRSGALWFATTQGLAKFTPGAERPPAQPRVFLTDLRLGGTPYPLSQLGATAISDLELNPSQNQLQVDFVGIDYEPGDILRYSYKLEGPDKAWSPPRSRHSVNFAALQSGRYRFLVKAITSEGVESAAPAEIRFTVLPPLWGHWWFQGLALAMAAAVVFAAHRYRVAQAVNLERVRTAIATDLHDDIGASLSQIAILSEVARVSANGHGHAGDPLEKVASLARELIDSMSDIVWSIRPEPDGIDSLIRRMREFALDLLAPQGIAFELRAPHGAEDRQFTLQARRQLLLMFKECIHNAARHSHATEVTAELTVQGREVALTVSDNGIGIGVQPPAGGTGIQGMRRRAKSLGGSVELRSEPGQGCSVTIRLPVRRPRAFV